MQEDDMRSHHPGESIGMIMDSMFDIKTINDEIVLEERANIVIGKM